MPPAISPLDRSARLILVRHGESLWNITDIPNQRVTRFTGWADVPLSDVGKQQARASGRCLAALWNKPKSVQYQYVYTSMLQRARESYNLMAEELVKNTESNKYREPKVVINHWRLNERHYGGLVGLSKNEAEENMGSARVKDWRRSWLKAPPPMSVAPKELPDRVKILHEPTIVTRESNTNAFSVIQEPGAFIPKSESLKDCADRVIPLLEEEIFPKILQGESVLIVAHSNTIRGLIKYIDKDTVTDESIRGVVVPSAIPLIYKFERATTKPKGPYSTLGMRARFHVSEELLELSLAANQWMEMSENLDHHGNLFQDKVRLTLAEMKRKSLSGVVKRRDESFMNFDPLH